MARRRPTPTTADEFVLRGPSNLPDPEFNAYRKDLADIALAGQVIASHYADPLDRIVAVTTDLRSAPSIEAAVVRQLDTGEPFRLLDDSLGWSWGYAGSERRVGYVRTEALDPS